MSIKKLDLSDSREAAAILELQVDSYVVEAALIGSSEIPPLKETLGGLIGCGETFYGCFERGRLAGAVSYKMGDGVLDVHRLMVHPDHFRKGIARSLIGHVERIEAAASRVVVSTGSENLPAVNLYRSLGFAEKGEVEVRPGLHITLFEKVRGEA